jgi:ATP/maltotriose-dependent transcriptional regulator MalT
MRWSDIHHAIERATQEWTPDTSHVDTETAYRDRTVLAAEVVRLRAELEATLEALQEADEEVDRIGKVLYEKTSS